MSKKHIDEFLDYYMQLENPQYAVLLKGKWGSGKTHYINRYKEHLTKRHQKYIYVSLYGVTSYDDIETKFLETLHPKLYNKKTILAGKIVKGFFKATLKVDFDGDGKADGSVSGQIPDFKPNNLLNTKESILIFDDLERCSIDIVDLLGYINYFIEHQSHKAILIANEDELDKTEEYKQIKEKLVGKTFEFKTDVGSAYSNFLDKLENRHRVKENVLEKYKDIVLTLFEESNCNNLRILRQSIFDFERFYDLSLKQYLQNEELIKDILGWFFIFSFETRQGNVEILDLDKLLDEYHAFVIKKEKEKAEKTKYLYFMNKYSFDEHFDVIISFEIWKEILVDSCIDIEKIDESILKSKYYFDENTALWKKLYNFHDLSDKEFEDLLDEVYSKFSANQYRSFEEVKMISSLLLFFKERDLVEKSYDRLVYDIKKQIDYIFVKDLVGSNVIMPKGKDLFDNNSYEGLGYLRSEEFGKIEEYLDKKIENKQKEKLSEDLTTILNAISQNDTAKLYSLLYHTTNKFVPYYDKPIFKYINIDELISSLKQCNNKTLRQFTHILDNRYEHWADKLVSERSFLENLNVKLISLADIRKEKLSGYYFNSFLQNIDKNIDKLVNVELNAIQKP